MFNGNNWIFFIIIGATVVQWVFGKLREQAELTRAKQDREKRRIDTLRTGQGVNTGASTTVSSTPTISQHDLQARRQAQLKALRDRQRALGTTGASSSQTPTGPTIGPATRTPTPAQSRSFPATSSQSAGKNRPLPSPQTSRQATIAAQRAARAKQVRINRQRQLQKQQQQQALSQSSQRSTPSAMRITKPKKSHIDKPKESRIGAPKKSRIAQRPSLEQDEARLATASKSRSTQAGRSLAPMTREDWRRAIIASEILAPPVSMREMD